MDSSNKSGYLEHLNIGHKVKLNLPWISVKISSPSYQNPLKAFSLKSKWYKYKLTK